MTIAYRCDGPSCATVLDDEATRIDVQVANEKIEQTSTVAGVEDGEFFTGEIRQLVTIGWNADTHFCSMSCLSAWAFAKQLDTPR